MSTADKLTTIAENVPKVYEAGQQSGYDVFWKAVNNSSKKKYEYFMHYGTISDEIMKPKTVVQPDSALYMFGRAKASKPMVLSHEHFDFSKCGSLRYAFACDGAFSEFTLVDLSSATGSSDLDYTFHDGYGNKTKKKIRIKCTASTAFKNTTFQNCIELTELFFTEDSIIAKSIDLSWSTKLTVASAKNILTTLKDFSGTSTSPSIILADETWVKLDADGATSPNGNTWREYILDKNWTE